jgi:NTE family protein
MNHQSNWAFVMGSGGVKSMAALGVAQVLEQAGHRPSLIVGCSAGALFGALLACGEGASAAIARAHQIWTPEATSQRRSAAWADLAGSALGLHYRKPFDERFGMRDDTVIVAQLQAAFGERTLESLPVPLRVIATDAVDGHTVVLTHGPIWQALRASMALPFLFAPQAMHGRLLVDGSVSDPIPLAHAGDAPARVAVGFAVPMPRRVDGPARLATRITASLTNNLMQAQLAAHRRARDVVLMPVLPRRIGLFETQALADMVALGRQSAQQALPQLCQALAPRTTTPDTTPDTTLEAPWALAA